MHWARRQKYGICGAVQAGRSLSTVYLPCTLFGLFCCLPVETANGTTWGLSILVNYCLLLGTGRTHGNLRLKKSKLRWGWLGGKWRYICRWGGGGSLSGLKGDNAKPTGGVCEGSVWSSCHPGGHSSAAEVPASRVSPLSSTNPFPI